MIPVVQYNRIFTNMLVKIGDVYIFRVIYVGEFIEDKIGHNHYRHFLLKSSFFCC